MHSMNSAMDVCSQELIYMFLVSQNIWPGLVKNVNIGIFSDTINIIKVKRCMNVLLIELYPFISLSVTLIVFKCHSSVEQF